MIRFPEWCLCTVFAAGALLPPPKQAYAKHPATAADEARTVEMKLRNAPLGEWSFDGFRVVKTTDPRDTPWQPFIEQNNGFAATFIDRRQDIPNTGKGGNAEGTKHPQFSLWIFRIAGPGTVKSFEDGILRYQMMQTSIPSVLGASRTYALVGVGDLDRGREQVVALAKALDVPLNGGR